MQSFVVSADTVAPHCVQIPETNAIIITPLVLWFNCTTTIRKSKNNLNQQLKLYHIQTKFNLREGFLGEGAN